MAVSRNTKIYSREQGYVPAGQKSTTLSNGLDSQRLGRRRMPNTKGYSDKTKVYSPVSRGI